MRWTLFSQNPKRSGFDRHPYFRSAGLRPFVMGQNNISHHLEHPDKKSSDQETVSFLSNKTDFFLNLEQYRFFFEMLEEVCLHHENVSGKMQMMQSWRSATMHSERSVLVLAIPPINGEI
jgi:hypothetical protein